MFSSVVEDPLVGLADHPAQAVAPREQQHLQGALTELHCQEGLGRHKQKDGSFISPKKKNILYNVPMCMDCTYPDVCVQVCN